MWFYGHGAEVGILPFEDKRRVIRAVVRVVLEGMKEGHTLPEFAAGRRGRVFDGTGGRGQSPWLLGRLDGGGRPGPLDPAGVLRAPLSGVSEHPEGRGRE